MTKSVARVLVVVTALAGALGVMEGCTSMTWYPVSVQAPGGGSAAVGKRVEMALPPVAAAGTQVVPTARPSSCNLPGQRYPQIETDGKVTFQFRAPDAQRVQVSIVDRLYEMVKGENGVWTYTTAQPQAPGYHNYWMVVDGAVVLDPATNAYIGYGHMCNGFEVPEPGIDWYDVKDVPHGDVLIKDYFAKTTNAWRKIFVYTPPGYSQSKTRYPVLYLQHGGGEDQRVWIEMGRTNVILDNLIAEKKCVPFIVVMETSAVGGTIPGPGGGGRGMGGGPGGMGGGPGGGAFPGRGGAAAPGPANAPAAAGPGRGGMAGGLGRGGMGRGGMGGMGGMFNAYGQLMVNDLIPFVDKNFLTIADKEHRAMSGLSMGGMTTRGVTLANPDVFSHVGIFSGGTISAADIANNETFKQNVKVVFMSNGSQEGGPAPLQAAAAALNEAGIYGVAYTSPGTAHEWQTWRRSLYGFAQLLFRE